jgi:hypothetical protein
MCRWCEEIGDLKGRSQLNLTYFTNDFSVPNAIENKDITMKTLIGFGFIACLIAAAYLAVYKSAESPPALQVSKNEHAAETDIIDEVHSQKGTKLNITPFPETTLTYDQCEAVDEERRTDLEQRSELALQAAMNAYLAGEPKEKIADAIWLDVTAFTAQQWYNTMAFYEATKRHKLAIESLSPAPFVAQEINEFHDAIESGAYQQFNVRVEQLFTNIDLRSINRAIAEKRELDDILSTVNSALAHIPAPLLHDPLLSPVKGLIKSALELHYYDLSIALIERYPSAMIQSSKYLNRFISTLLSSLYQSIANEPDKGRLQRIVALLQKENDAIVLEDMPAMFGPAYASAAASKLNALGININYAKLEDLKPMAVDLDLVANTPAQDALREKYEQCRAPKEWLATRRYSQSEWQSFAPTPLTQKAVDSFEFALCNVNKSAGDFVGRSSAVQNAVRDMQVQLSSKSQSLFDVLPSELPIPELTKDERAIVIALIADGYLENPAYSEEKVKTLMASADLLPEPVSMEAKQVLLSQPSATLWLDIIDFDDHPTSYMALNQLAYEGKFELFNALKSKIEVKNKALFDPLYFFLLGYSELTTTGGNSFALDNTDNELFASYFTENDYEFLPHHQRLMLEKKLNQQPYFEKITTLLPQFEVSNPEDFFSISCK